jgi:hypothetical protein
VKEWRRCRVEVETGNRQDAQPFAAAVDATVADPASWTGQGRWSLQRVDGDDVALYRKYVVNHEVGHALGYGHQACPGPGRQAPVMQQQALGLDGCLRNGSPYVAGFLVSGPAVS